MNLKGRLGKLERFNKSDLADHDSLMASLIGQIDGLFWPTTFDESDWSALPTIYRMRRQYHERGIAWAGLAADRNAAAWKKNQRARESLRKAGLITINKEGRVPLIKPTAEAMDQARTRLGLHNRQSLEVLRIRLIVALGLVSLGEFREQPDAHPCAPGELGWCHELWITDEDDYSSRPTRSDWAPFAKMVLPLLISGEIEFKQTTVGHVCYRLCCPEWQKLAPASIEDLESEQAKFLKAAKELGEHCAQSSDPECQVSDDVKEIYFAALQDQLSVNRNHPKTHEIFIPLPATSIGVPTAQERQQIEKMKQKQKEE